MTLLDAIINGHGSEIKELIAGMYSYKELASKIVCQDGVEISVQCSRFHYCEPRSDDGPYTAVEVGFPTEDPPESWAEYADGNYPADVYGYVPAELVRQFIESHGGEQPT